MLKGNFICEGLETPKNCPSDCTPVCSDGSCDAGEIASCQEDCMCPDAATYSDAPSVCGDQYCQIGPQAFENCETCPADCPQAERCDGFDNDCDGLIDEDFDVDQDDFTTCAGDCDDFNASINPGAVELPGNEIDENCDGL